MPASDGEREPTIGESTLERELEAIRRELQALQEEHERLVWRLHEHVAREANVERALQQLSAERERLLADAERVAASRAWRYGHGVMRTLGRITRRSLHEEGAIDVMIARLRAAPALLPGPSLTELRGVGRVPAMAGRRSRRQPDEERLAELARVESVTVIVPVFNAAAQLERCLESLARYTGPRGRLLVVDDHSTDPAIAALLERWEELAGVRVLRNERNLGFTATINRGLTSTAGDVALLNSDTEVGPRWLEQLMLTAYEDPSIGTVTAVSNNAGAFSIPRTGEANPLPAGLSRPEMSRLVAQTAKRMTLRPPTGSGFCLYLKRACIESTGPFDEERFPRGYGEENDFCMRAGARGWRHAVDDATWVFHEREASLGAEKAGLVEAARAAVDRLHPAYTEQVRAFMGSPEVQELREAADDTYRVAARPGSGVLPRLLFVLHEGGGGVPATNQDLLGALSATYDCLALTSDGRTLRLWQAEGEGAPVRQIDEWALAQPWRVTDFTRSDVAVIARSILTSYGIELVHVRHLFKHTLDAPLLAIALGLPLVVSFHDYYMSCPTVHLLDERDRFCGGRCTDGDGACRIPSPLLQGTPHLKHQYVHVWRERFLAVLAHADALVTTSPHVREVYLRSYPSLSGLPFDVIEHGRDLEQAHDVAIPPRPGGPVRILVPGNLDVHKGADLLARMKELDTGGRLDLHFLGRVPDGYRDLGVQHGPYERDEFTERARTIGASFVGVFSITAETYSHSLTEAWAAGIPVLATDLGALRERVARDGGGWLLAPDDPAAVLRRILEIADDPAEYERERARANLSHVATVAEMGADYDALYQRVLGRRRAIHSGGAGPMRRLAPEPIRLAAYLPNRPAAPPASSHVRVLRRSLHPQVGWGVAPRIPADDRLRELDRIEVALVQRTGVPPELTERFLAQAADRDVRVVFDLDDDLFALGPDDPVYGPALAGLRRLVDDSDTVIVTSERLREAIGVAPERAAIVPNMQDERLWFGPVEEEETAADEGRPIRLLFVGTRTHSDDLAMFRPVLERLRTDCGLECELCVIGGGDVIRPGEQSWYTEVRVPTGVYSRFVPWLRGVRHRWDIAIAPLRDTPFNHGKSDLKLLDYGALGIPAVYSDVPAFGTCLDGETGLKAANDVEAWTLAVERLCRDVDLRRHISETAMRYVREQRCLAHEGPGWLDALWRTAPAAEGAAR